MSAGRPTPVGGSRPMAAGNALGIPFSSQDAATYQYTPGSYTFTAPRSGYWKFVQWGGGDGLTNATSGGYTEYTAFLGVGQTVALVVGIGLGGGLDTTATFQNGKVVTAGTASGGSPGIATGGDVNLAGSAAGANGAGTGGGTGSTGAGAPANLPFRGGGGAASGSAAGKTPGGGGGTVSGTGGDGMAIVFFVRS